jgi:uncharacterized membrane protein
MSLHPPVVARIAEDYLDRVRARLAGVSPREQDEFLKEVHSHVYEAYQQAEGEDEVGRMLAVLRKLGEPADVVADRLPQRMVRSGAAQHLPLRILGGILIALFGLPLGIGGVASLAGVLLALAAVLAAYYAAAGAILLSAATFMALGLLRLYRPELWDKLVTLGVIQMDEHVADALAQLPASGQGVTMIVAAAVLLALALGMVWLGRFLVRGLRSLVGLAFDAVRRLAARVRTSNGGTSLWWTGRRPTGFATPSGT